MSHKNKVWYFFINWTHSFNQNLEKEIANLLTLQKPLLVLPSTYYSSRWQLLWLVTAQITLDSLCRATQFSPLQLAQKTYKRNHTLSILLYAQLYAWEIHLCVYTHTHTHTQIYISSIYLHMIFHWVNIPWYSLHFLKSMGIWVASSLGPHNAINILDYAFWWLFHRVGLIGS